VLRAVSPVHIEYLQNMGVRASMSVSIVVQGRLWGLIACHHRTPRHVPYSVRMACDVLAHMLASTVASLTAADESAYVTQAAAVRTRVIESMLHADDTLAALAAMRNELRESLEADELLLAEHGKVIASDGVEPALAAAIVQSLAAHQDGSPVLRLSRDEWPEAIRESLGRHVGLLALPFHPSGHGWIIALRHEQIEHVRWGGQPEKQYRSGPLGPRLTPRGSMDEWRETVRDRADPWRNVVREAAGDLLAELQRASTARIIEADRMRSQLLAMLGHDLRDPLTTIHMATSLIKRGAGAEQFEQRISNASGRMQRLIDHVMDLSRIGAGMGLGLRPTEVDLSVMLRDIITEASLAHPGASYDTDIAPEIVVQLDADRIAQVIANLLSNARHHGEVGQPIVIRLSARDDAIEFEVRNAGKPIDSELAALLFSPFKHQSLGNVHNRKGLGLGLFIAHEVVTGHEGRIDYRYEEPHVVFRVSLPLRRA
jgi:chemotaxis family two-component system sensor kinase Cph1